VRVLAVVGIWFCSAFYSETSQWYSYAVLLLRLFMLVIYWQRFILRQPW